MSDRYSVLDAQNAEDARLHEALIAQRKVIEELRDIGRAHAKKVSEAKDVLEGIRSRREALRVEHLAEVARLRGR